MASPQHRANCRLHALRRAEERGLALDAESLLRMEIAAERLKAAFELPDVERYWLRGRIAGVPLRFVYDIRMACVVTVVPGCRLC